jgi:hypothetical protein
MAMLRGWPIALVAATGASGLLGFGVIQSAYAQQAQALFLVFAAVLGLVLFGNKFFGRGGHGHAHGGEHAVVMSGRSVGTVTVLAAVAAVVYFWTANDLSAEKIGRYIDRGAASLSRQAQLTFTQLTDGRADESVAEEPQAPPQGG